MNRGSMYKDDDRVDNDDSRFSFASKGLPLQDGSTPTARFSKEEDSVDEEALHQVTRKLLSLASSNGPIATNAVLKGIRHERFGRRDGVVNLEGESYLLSLRSIESTPHFSSALERSMKIERAMLRVQHEASLLERAENYEGLALLDDAIDTLSDAATSLSKASFFLPTILSHLGIALDIRFQRIGEVSDIQEAISLHHHASDLTPNDDPTKCDWVNNIGSALMIRFNRFGELGDLEGAILSKRRAIELAPDDRPDKSGMLCNLVEVLQARFDLFGDLNDLEQAIVSMCRAVEFAPDNHPYKSRMLGILGNLLQMRFERIGELEDLEHAILLMRPAIELTPDNSTMLNNLGVALVRRFIRLGDLEDLEQGISSKRRAIELLPDSDLEKFDWLGNLGAALEMRFERLGEFDDLEQAIASVRRAVEIAPGSRPDKFGWLGNLGIVLMKRFERLGELEDLEQAILSMRRAVELAPDNHPSRPDMLNNLGNMLDSHFERFGDLEDLEQAILLKRHALELTLDDHPDKSGRVISLGATLKRRFDRSGDPEDLKQTISTMRHGVELTSDSHPRKSGRLSNLGVALRARFHLLGNLEDLEQAISQFHQANALIPELHPEKLHLLRQLGDTDLLRLSAGDQSAFADALGHFSAIFASDSGLALERFQAARTLISLIKLRIMGDDLSNPYDGLMSVYKRAFMLIPEVVWLGFSITRRFELVKSIGEFASGAAANAIAAGELTLAIEWLEQGRSVVWGQILQLRGSMDDKLRQQHPHLALRLQGVSRELQGSANIAGEVYSGGANRLGDKHGRTNAQDEITARIQSAKEYRELLSQVRKLQGFESFLMPKTLAEIAHTWGSNTDRDFVILINVHTSRCDALVCMAADRIIPVSLPDLTLKIAEKLLEQFTDSIHASGIRKREAHGHPSDTSLDYPNGTCDDLASEPHASRGAIRAEADRSLADVLYVLWIYVARPVLQIIQRELRDIGTAENLPHVTWCPTGPLTSLPIHAAGEYGDTRGPRGPRLFDFIVSSYTPNLSLPLQRPMCSPQAQLSASPKILAISQPHTPGRSPLPATVQETAMLKHHFSVEGVIHLNHTEATVGAALHAMDEHQCPYLHLACHGMQDLDNPRKSAFMLYDGNLDLGRLMSKPATQATLAFLSACQTATGDAKLTEESIHLAAGTLATGYQGVIGTLWSIMDEDAPLVADVFYRTLKERETKLAESRASESQVHAAYALHEATKALRKIVGESNILRWAPFMHFGR